jgi:DNA-binding transcriptional ArsR family regulator
MMSIEEEYLVTDLETIKIISDPLRVQILEHIGLTSEVGKLITVKEIAEALDIPPTKLYYHINLLEKHDLIRVAETRVVSGIIEKLYQIRARHIRAELDLSQDSQINRNEGLELTLSSISTMLDTAYQNLEKSFRLRVEEIEAGQPDLQKSSWYSSQSMLQLSPQQVQEFTDEMKLLVSKYTDQNDPEGQVFGLTILFNPNYHLKRPADDV